MKLGKRGEVAHVATPAELEDGWNQIKTRALDKLETLDSRKAVLGSRHRASDKH